MEAASFSAALTAVQSAIHDLLSTIKENAADAARYLSTADPLSAAIFLLAFFIFYCWVVSIITGNYSQVDRFWPIFPTVYAWHFGLLRPLFFKTEELDARLTLMAVLVTLWGVRLTFNYMRKGGYKRGHEDYRWPELRQRMSPALFQLFNFAFIAVGQNIILLLFSSPLYVAWRARGTPLNLLDLIAAVLFLCLLAGETIADQQQWNFQTEKYRRIANKMKLTGDYERGFITTGLFRYSRHPNFFCEISMWFVFYLFSVAASGVLINWTLIGACLLCLLFQGSTNFTESISLRKYPAYAQYQQTTSRLIPYFPAKLPATPARSPRSPSPRRTPPRKGAGGKAE